MKKIIAVLVLLITMSSVVFAGSIDVDILAQDNAQLFIGTLEDFTTVKNPHTQQEFVDTAVVTAVEKIKGDVEIGVAKTYSSGCHFESGAEKGTQHLFVYFNEHNFYLYEMASWDNGKIKLKNSDKYGLTKSVEDMINDGTYARAEEERLKNIIQTEPENDAVENNAVENAEGNNSIMWIACVVAIALILVVALWFVIRKSTVVDKNP